MHKIGFIAAKTIHPYYEQNLLKDRVSLSPEIPSSLSPATVKIFRSCRRRYVAEGPIPFTLAVFTFE